MTFIINLRLCCEIFLYNGDAVIKLTDANTISSEPQINNLGQVIWRAWGDLYLYDGTANINLSNSGNLTQVNQHDINNKGQVVWIDGSKIYMYDGDSISMLSNNPQGVKDPQINDNGHVVWNGYNGTSWEIFLYPYEKHSGNQDL